jgi:hypothetical protein
VSDLAITRSMLKRIQLSVSELAMMRKSRNTPVDIGVSISTSYSLGCSKGRDHNGTFEQFADPTTAYVLLLRD